MKAKIGNTIKDIQRTGNGSIRIGEKEYEVDARQVEPGVFSLIVDGKSYQASVSKEKDGYQVLVDHHVLQVQLEEPQPHPQLKKPKKPNGKIVITSSIPGRIVGIKVKKGQRVCRGEGLLLIEAMKMENEILSPEDGKISDIYVAAGDLVAADGKLLILN